MSLDLNNFTENSNQSTNLIQTKENFQKIFLRNLKSCNWEPHPLYSVFTQYDQNFYLSQKDAFIHKYRSFYAVSKTISPKKIIELGTLAGSSADAYLSASPQAEYIGIDVFGVTVREDNGLTWDPHEIAHKLFESKGFTNYELIKKDLRRLTQLPSEADLVVVDAAHDFYSEYEDLNLALTAKPSFIFVDDADDINEAKPAIEEFLYSDVADLVEYTVPITYTGGGLVIKLKQF